MIDQGEAEAARAMLDLVAEACDQALDFRLQRWDELDVYESRNVSQAVELLMAARGSLTDLARHFGVDAPEDDAGWGALAYIWDRVS